MYLHIFQASECFFPCLRKSKKSRTMLRADTPQRLIHDVETNRLTVYYHDTHIVLKGCTRDDNAPEFNRKNLFSIEDRMTFNISGVAKVSFVNRHIGGATCPSRRPRHLRTCGSILEMRPWLRRTCKTCIHGDRQGSLGHYYQQKSMIAAPLT